MVIPAKLIPILSIIAGVIVLVMPRFLPYVVGIFLIAYGLIKILG